MVEKAKQEKQSTIVRAEGEAQAAELIGKAIMNNPGFLQLRKIENAREIASIVANAKNRVFLSAETLLLNINEKYALLYSSVFIPGSDEAKKAAELKVDV